MEGRMSNCSGECMLSPFGRTTQVRRTSSLSFSWHSVAWRCHASLPRSISRTFATSEQATRVRYDEVCCSFVRSSVMTWIYWNTELFEWAVFIVHVNKVVFWHACSWRSLSLYLVCIPRDDKLAIVLDLSVAASFISSHGLRFITFSAKFVLIGMES